MQMDEDLMLRCEIIKTGIELLKKGLIQGTGGNISAKTKDGFFFDNTKRHGLHRIVS